jgi:riboflavin synthase
MFTGLIECMGNVVEVTPRSGAVRIAIRSALPVSEMKDGESVAVDGVCLTVSNRAQDRFHLDAVQETLQRTTLGRIRPGQQVNLERALRASDRLGGHLVSGHVDETTTLTDVRRRGADYRVRFRLADSIRRYVAQKGSIAVQGVSLTVSDLAPAEFEVALVPETLERTNLGKLRPGDPVNLEVDLLARYLDRLLEARHQSG